MLETNTYGEIFGVNEDNELEKFSDISALVYGFHGRCVDEETNLYFFCNRYYNSKFGRFLQHDPISYNGGSMGLYEAFAGNPYHYKDPDGKTPRGAGNKIVAKQKEKALGKAIGKFLKFLINKVLKRSKNKTKFSRSRDRSNKKSYDHSDPDVSGYSKMYKLSKSRNAENSTSR